MAASVTTKRASLTRTAFQWFAGLIVLPLAMYSAVWFVGALEGLVAFRIPALQDSLWAYLAEAVLMFLIFGVAGLLTARISALSELWPVAFVWAGAVSALSIWGTLSEGSLSETLPSAIGQAATWFGAAVGWWVALALWRGRRRSGIEQALPADAPNVD